MSFKSRAGHERNTPRAITSLSILANRLHLDFEPAWATLGTNLFLLGNWNLRQCGVLAAPVLAWRQLTPPALVPIAVIVAPGTVFLFVVVTLTNLSAWVADQTTVSRATLHFAPVAAVFSALAFRAFALRWADRHAIGDAPGA